MGDTPVQIVHRAMTGQWDDPVVALEALHAAGWRIVRAAETDVQFDDDPDSPTYEQHVPVWTIAEVWTPASGAAAPEGDDTDG